MSSIPTHKVLSISKFFHNTSKRGSHKKWHLINFAVFQPIYVWFCFLQRQITPNVDFAKFLTHLFFFLIKIFDKMWKKLFFCNLFHNISIRRKLKEQFKKILTYFQIFGIYGTLILQQDILVNIRQKLFRVKKLHRKILRSTHLLSQRSA